MKEKLIYICVCLMLFSCHEEYIGQPSTDSTKPNVIVGTTVKNIPGGAVIHYKIPNDNDLLYVKGIYRINGVEYNASASIYTDSLKIEGFSEATPQTVQLYCVDRSNNMSDPVDVVINPETPPIRIIGSTFKMAASFGGVSVEWENPTKAMMAFYFLAENLATKEMELADIVYSSAKAGSYTLRGFDTQEREFWCVARDHWNNYSDTIKGRFAPFYEEQIQGKNIKRVELPVDNMTDNGDYWAFTKMFDGLTTDGGGWHIYTPKSPIMFTIDLGAPVKLSRYVLWHTYNQVFAHHNPKKWKVYGLKTEEELERLRREHPSEIEDYDYWANDFQSDWIKIMDCESKTQSGSQTATADDISWERQNGLEFEFSLDMEPVRYLRFWVTETWGSGTACTYVMIGEIQLFGEIQK